MKKILLSFGCWTESGFRCRIELYTSTRHRSWYIFVFLSREEFKISGRNYVYTNLYDDVYINLLDDEAYQICNKVI